MVVNCQLSLAEDHEHQLNTSDGDQQRCSMLLHNFQVLVVTQNKLMSRYDSVGLNARASKFGTRSTNQGASSIGKKGQF